MSSGVRSLIHPSPSASNRHTGQYHAPVVLTHPCFMRHQASCPPALLAQLSPKAKQRQQRASPVQEACCERLLCGILAARFSTRANPSLRHWRGGQVCRRQSPAPHLAPAQRHHRAEILPRSDAVGPLLIRVPQFATEDLFQPPLSAQRHDARASFSQSALP